MLDVSSGRAHMTCQVLCAFSCPVQRRHHHEHHSSSQLQPCACQTSDMTQVKKSHGLQQIQIGGNYRNQ